MKIQLILICDYGEFKGEIIEVDNEQLENIINLSKTYYNSGFEMTLENGSWIIVSPEIIKKSILKIEKVV